MAITKRQQVERRRWFGSSDVPALLGVDPRRTAKDILLDKLGMIEPGEQTPAMWAGTLLEPALLLFAEKELGPIRRNVRRVYKPARIAANIDAIVKETAQPVEAKSSGVYSSVTAREWGEPGTDECPDYVIVQAQVHMLCAEQPVCHVPACVGGRGFLMYRVPANETLIELIIDTAKRYADMLDRGQVPEDTEASLATIKRIRRVPKKIVRVDEPDALLAYLEAAERKRQAEAEYTAAKKTLLNMLGDAEALDFGGYGAITYYEQHRKETVLPAATFRVARFRKHGIEITNESEVVDGKENADRTGAGQAAGK